MQSEIKRHTQGDTDTILGNIFLVFLSSAWLTYIIDTIYFRRKNIISFEKKNIRYRTVHVDYAQRTCEQLFGKNIYRIICCVWVINLIKSTM